MSDNLQNVALGKFFEFYQNDVEFDVIDSDNVVLSFPVHFSGFHRIEVTITRVTPDQFLISDGAKTLDELRMAGYRMSKQLHARVESISKAAGIRVIRNHLVSNSDLTQLGQSIQRFLEAAKTIGDAYLVQRLPSQRSAQILTAPTEERSCT